MLVAPPPLRREKSVPWTDQLTVYLGHHRPNMSKLGEQVLGLISGRWGPNVCLDLTLLAFVACFVYLRLGRGPGFSAGRLHRADDRVDGEGNGS